MGKVGTGATFDPVLFCDISELTTRASLEQDPVWYVNPSNGAPSILQANDEDHARG